MTRRIRNALVGAVIALVVWVVWSLVRHAVPDGSLVFENIGRSLQAALLGAIAGYILTCRAPHGSPGKPSDKNGHANLSIDMLMMPLTRPETLDTKLRGLDFTRA
jgi:hypothetical protein